MKNARTKTVTLPEPKEYAEDENQDRPLDSSPELIEIPFGNAGLKRFRRLKWNELVSSGDFVPNLEAGVEPWEGPSGFQAGSFLKPIYRQEKTAKATSPIPKL
jgi:hypothetical protein